MSASAVELLRVGADAFNRADWDGVLAILAPDVVIDNSMNRADWAGVHEGHAGALRMLNAVTEPWQSVRMEIHKFVEAGDHVVTEQTMHFEGRDGIAVTAHVNWLWTISNRAVVRVIAFNELDDALAAAGLPR